ncbi:MAG TPA: hypothetical protein VHY19_00065 [Steroidobacteraceae bacterium]|jgi:tetratricopeptide (TPR) repeat protein|nr:hypothetical protein [Steroidobacteraceae bacterium]
MKRRNYVAVIGLASAAALSLSGIAQAAEKADKQPTVSACLAKSLKAAQDAKNANNYDLEIQKIKEAQNTPKCNKSPFDEYLMNSWLGVAYIGTKDYADAATALQAAAESQYTTSAGRRQMLQAVVSIYSQLRQYPKAIAAGQAAIKAGNADAPVYVTVASAQESLGQHKEAADTIQRLIDKEGTKPEEKYLEFQWEAYGKANDQADAAKVIDKLVTLYPKPDYWANALQPLAKMTVSDAHLQLEIYRLMFDVGVLKLPQDFGEMAELAYDAGYPGETVAVLQKAFAQNIFTNPSDSMRYQHLMMTAMGKAQTDQASLAAQESKAQSAAGGDQLVGVGAAYLSYGQADKAVSVIEAGIAKGGLKRPEEANLLLGIAQLRSHDAAAAHRSFDKVASSSNPGYAQLGRLWMLHSQNHSAG